jgi:hypothetical protein
MDETSDQDPDDIYPDDITIEDENEYDEWKSDNEDIIGNEGLEGLIIGDNHEEASDSDHDNDDNSTISSTSSGFQSCIDESPFKKQKE